MEGNREPAKLGTLKLTQIGENEKDAACTPDFSYTLCSAGEPPTTRVPLMILWENCCMTAKSIEIPTVRTKPVLPCRIFK